MRLLFLAPLKRKITPRITAARPRVIFDLISGLLKRGHQISLLGTKDSKIPGIKIIPIVKKELLDLKGHENPFYDHTAYLVKMAAELSRIASNYDVIHNHTYPEFINLLALCRLKQKSITTIHGQMTPALDEAFSSFNGQNLIAISKAAKKEAKKTKVSRVIYNGVDTDLYSFQKRKENYLLWIGRLSKSKDKAGNFLDPKGIKHAIKLARESGEKLFLSGNVEDLKFFDLEVKPHLNSKIRWIGPVQAEQPLTKKEVVTLMRKAKAFLMPINWQEPFGLVMAESMSTGTPVIGFNRGSVPELIKSGKTGFVVKKEEGVAGLKKALAKIGSIKPRDCRDHVLENFSLQKMVTEYEKYYLSLLEK